MTSTNYCPGTLDDPRYIAALSAWQTFCTCRGKVNRGGGLPEKGAKRFHEVASICVEHDWCASDYVRYVFENCNWKARADITGKDLCDPRAVDLFNGLSFKQSVTDTHQQWSYCEELLKGILRRGSSSAEDALKNPDVPFTSWFRVLFPWPPLVDTYVLFGRDARDQIEENSTLRSDLDLICPTQLNYFLSNLNELTEGDVC